jgi:hypothetical protein
MQEVFDQQQEEAAELEGSSIPSLVTDKDNRRYANDMNILHPGSLFHFFLFLFFGVE